MDPCVGTEPAGRGALDGGPRHLRAERIALLTHETVQIHRKPRFNWIARTSKRPDQSYPDLATTMPKVHLLDYVAGNVRSLVNAIEKVGFEVEWIRSPEEVAKADVSYNLPPGNAQ